ncbi:SusC/RagA family TonB-linked outer membrane protein [Polaribacter tangerinus]|uniref:SusC/RagA family TonB-linked outer membrane protein n=1 Tax=Polaribacter tangerinus TaxID=1920034 RepID=UPI000B4A64AC|nr:SusC/RagA family TonB-linked outer membrane protein [Polaribacter tangerinus]
MKKHIVLLLLLVSSIGLSQIKITGTISDKKTGEKLPSVGILTSEKNGTTSNLNGEYSIVVTNKNSYLTFSYLGYKTVKIPVKNKTIIDVSLEEVETNLEEIIVTALGVNRRTKELGYAVQALNSSDINTIKTPNFSDNLTGKLAGVTVVQGATGVGSSSKITIRGEASFSNNNPLFIVDGTPINNNTVFNFTNDAAAGFQEIDFGNGAMEINTDDIATISVLKGQSAAAIYGARAANGVVVINTKNGTENEGLGIEINSGITFENAFRLPKFQNKYGQGNSGSFEFVDGLGGGINDNITYSWGPELDAENYITQFDSPVILANGTEVRAGDTSLYSNLLATPTLFKSHPNNLKKFYKTGISTTHNIAISNAFNNGNYRLSLTKLNNESIIPGVNLERKTAALKMNFYPSEKTAVRSSINYINTYSRNRPSNGYGSENVNYSLVAWGPRSLNIESLRNYWQPGLEGKQQYSFNYTFFDNPFFILHENTNSFGRDRVFGNVSFKHNFTTNLDVTIRTGIDYSSEKRVFKRNFSTNRFKNGAYAEHDVFYKEINTDFLINYAIKMSHFSLKTSFGGNRFDQNTANKQLQTLNLAQPGIFSLNNAASPIEAFQLNTKKRINSLFGIAKFSFKNYLFADITGRNDWSSALATPVSTANTSFFYPSFSTSLILSNLVKLPTKLSFAKIRASIAKVGNDTNPYQTSTAFVSQTPFNGAPTFSNQNFISNKNLLPEATTSYEVGTDIRFFNNRLFLDFTYYKSITKNQIISLPIPVSSGYQQQVVNGGKVVNTGLEIILNSELLKTPNFNWNTTFNFDTNRAIIKKLPQENGRLTLAYSSIYNSANQTVWFQVEEGGRIGDMYGTGYKKNENGVFLIDDEGRFIADNNLKKIGNYNPDFTLGWNNRFTYKNWSASFLLDWRNGGEIVSRTRALGNVGGQLAETSNRPTEGIIADGVHVNTGLQNTIAVSAESYYRQFYDRNHEENNVYDASFVKLRQFAIGYNFPLKKGLFGLHKSTNINFSFIGNNIFVITENPHFDPEQLAVQGNGFVSGVEDMSYATTRSLGFKIGLNF